MRKRRRLDISNEPNPLRSCVYFQVFRLRFDYDFLNLLLVKFHQAGIIIVKHLIHGRKNEAWVGVESLTSRSPLSQKTTLVISVERFQVSLYIDCIWINSIPVLKPRSHGAILVAATALAATKIANSPRVTT